MTEKKAILELEPQRKEEKENIIDEYKREVNEFLIQQGENSVDESLGSFEFYNQADKKLLMLVGKVDDEELNNISRYLYAILYKKSVDDIVVGKEKDKE